MIDRPQVSVVAALFHDAAAAPELAQRVCRALENEGTSFELILVDDGSTDDTAAVIQRLAAGDERVRAIGTGVNSGQATALARGVFAATGEIIITMDGDLQDPPEEIPKLLRALAHAEIANGCRLERHESRRRYLASRAVHWLACWLTGRRLRDFGGNFKGYRRCVVDAMRPQWRPRLPLFTLALARPWTVMEVDVHREGRRFGRSRYTLGANLRVVYDMLSTFPGSLMRALLATAAVVIIAVITVRGGPWPAALAVLVAGALVYGRVRSGRSCTDAIPQRPGACYDSRDARSAAQ